MLPLCFHLDLFLHQKELLYVIFHHYLYTMFDLKFYQNEELLALNKDGFVGKPLSDDLWNAKNQIWYGQMSDGDYIVGFFNKEDNEYDRTLDFSEIGIEGKVKVRDLWKHQDEGEAETSLSYKIPGRSCKIVRLTKSE